MRRFIEFLLRYRYAMLAVLLLVTAGFAATLPRAIIATNFAELFFSADEEFDRYLERTAEMTNDHMMLIGIETEHPLALETLDKLQLAVPRIESLPEVRQVASVLSAGKLLDEDDELHVYRYVEEVQANPERQHEVMAALLDNPLWSGVVVSKEGRHLSLLVELHADNDRQAEAERDFLDAVRGILTDAGFDEQGLYYGGSSPVMAEMFNQVYRNLTRIFPVVAFGLFLIGFIMFRKLWPVIITLTVAFLAVVWTSGFSLLIDPEVNLFLSVVPVIILVISFADVIHLCSAYMLELSTGKSKREAILASGADVGAACLFTSLTTFVGFTALAFVPSPVMQQFGMVLGFGVGATLLIAITLVPIIFSFMQTPPPQPRVTSGKDWITQMLLGSEKFAVRRPWVVVGISIAVVILSGMGMKNLVIDASMLERFSSNNMIRQGADFFEEHFAGTSTMSVFLDSVDDADMLDPDRFAAMAAFQAKLAESPHVDQIVSFVDLMEQTHLEMREPDDTSRLPQTRAEMAGYLMLYELAGEGNIDQLLTNDRRTMQMVIRTSESTFRQAYAMGQDIRIAGAEVFGDSVRIEPGGLLYFLGRWLDELVDGQKRGLLFSILTITLMMIIGLRSLRVGLASMLPNLLPLIVLGGVLGFVWDTADSDTLIVAMIAIGIGVDDTIHFLMRYRIEAQRTRDQAVAIQDTFHFAGRAIMITSIILVVGFVPLMMSDYRSFILLGSLLPMTLVVALLANIFVVPALIKLGLMRFDFHPSEEPPSEKRDMAGV